MEDIIYLSEDEDESSFDIKEIIKTQKIMQDLLMNQKIIISKQHNLIASMSSKLNEKDKEIKNIQKVLDKLIYSLHHKDKQSSAIKHYQHILYNKEGILPLFNPEEHIHPTTRQGDVNEIKINNIRKVVDSLIIMSEVNNMINKKRGNNLFDLLYSNINQENLDEPDDNKNDSEDDLNIFKISPSIINAFTKNFMNLDESEDEYVDEINTDEWNK